MLGCCGQKHLSGMALVGFVLAEPWNVGQEKCWCSSFLLVSAVQMEWLLQSHKMFPQHFQVGKHPLGGLQLHLCFVHGAGGFGVDFSLATDDFKSGIDLVSQKILSHGVTSFCPTLVTSPPSVYHQVSDFLMLSSTG